MNSSFSVFKNDFKESFNRLELAYTLAWADIRGRYARSIIGPFWVSVSTFVVVTAMSFLITGLFGGDLKKTAPFIFISIISYQFISQAIQEGSVAFVGNRHHLLGSPMPYMSFILNVIIRNLLLLLHQVPVLVITFIGLGVPFHWGWLLVIPGLLVVALTVTGLGLLLATLSARFRDIIPLTSLVLSVGALLSPVYWRPSALVKNTLIAKLNPISYLLEVIRGPIVGFELGMLTWPIALGICVISWVLALIVFHGSCRKLAFWI